MSTIKFHNTFIIKIMNHTQQPEQNEEAQSHLTQKRKFSPSYTRILTHFKNCIHEGYFSESMRRQGPGITILDGGSVVLGLYRNDQNTGTCCIFLTIDMYFIGEFNKGALDGGFVIRSPSVTMYSAFVNNKIQGEILVIDYQSWIAQLWTIENDGQGSISREISLGEIMNSYMSYEQIKRMENNISKKLDKTRYIPYQASILKSLAPYMEKLPNVSQFVKSIKLGSNEFQNIGPQVFSHKVYQNNEMIMLSSAMGNANDSDFLGIVLNKKEEIIAYGQFKEVDLGEKIGGKEKMSSFQYSYALNGIGMLIQESGKQGQNKNGMQIRTFYTGQFINNRLSGEGCKWIVGQKVIYGKFVDGNIRNSDLLKLAEEKDDEIKKLELKRIKSIHIHSLKFYNNYSNERPIYLILNLFEMMHPKGAQDGD